MGIVEMFMEIDKERFKVTLLNSVVNAVMAFLILQFVLSFFGIPFYITFISIPVVFFISMRYYLRKYDIGYVGKDPSVVEILKTAKDNIRKENVIVEMFFRDVTQRARNISIDRLLSMKYLTARIAIIFVFMILLVLVPAKEVAPEIAGFFGNVFDNGISDVGSIGFKDPNDIYGDPELVNLGNEKLQINIQPSNNEIDFSQFKEIDRKEFSRNPFPTEAEAVVDTPSNEKEPEDFELIKEYNLRIRKEI
jgi:hypothetical protein